MNIRKHFLPVLAVAMAVSPVFAQQSEAERAEMEKQAAAAQLEQAELEQRMREAEQQLAEAAQRIAELSARQLPRVAEITRQFRIDGRPKLGITIGDEESGPVEGVRIMGVSPGGAANEAGLRADDVITAMNGEPMTAASSAEASGKLLDFMSGVEEGDVLKVDYLRKGKSGSVELTPQTMSGHVFAFGDREFDLSVPRAPTAPGAPAFDKYLWLGGGSGIGHMELVSLTPGLGKYFGTDKGLLVVRAPKNDSFKLEDGDVIQRIDGREPTSVSHAMRILGSYQAGEKFKLEIMRDRKRQTVSVDMPDNRQSQLGDRSAIGVVIAPAPTPATAPAKPAEKT